MKTGSKTMDRTDQRQVLEAFSKDFNREMHNLQERPDTIWQQMYTVCSGPIVRIKMGL